MNEKMVKILTKTLERNKDLKIRFVLLSGFEILAKGARFDIKNRFVALETSEDIYFFDTDKIHYIKLESESKKIGFEEIKSQMDAQT